MITIKSNIGEVTNELKEKLLKLADKENLPRILAFHTIDLMTNRIHQEGKAANEQQIGTYNKSYLKLRERKYNRSSDTKIIVSLTRQLENDWSVIATNRGYGVGFKNSFNLQKARWVEENKKVAIFSLSPTEERKIGDIITQLVADAFT